MKRDTRSAFRARARATDASITAAVDAVAAERDERYRAAKEAAREAEATRHRFTRDEVLDATHVRDRFGSLREVVRVNLGGSWSRNAIVCTSLDLRLNHLRYDILNGQVPTARDLTALELGWTFGPDGEALPPAGWRDGSHAVRCEAVAA